MSHQPAAASTPVHESSERAAHVTKSLLGYGVLAGLVYVIAWLAQALTRDGFDLTRHSASLLTNGSLGWIQIANLVVTGLMVIAAAIGLGRALRPGIAAQWGARLLAVYGVSLIAAGIFRADPAGGFPPGTATGQAEASWHGMLHLIAGAVGFIALVAAMVIVARRFAADDRRGWAAYSIVSGILFLAAFVGISSGSTTAAVVLSFSAAVVLGWAWLGAVSIRLYRDVPSK